MVDISKAFDSVNHKLLLEKLHSLGIVGTELQWFFSGRKQRVVMNGVCAEWSDVKAGVPQGTILGLLLFITFVNDLPSSVNYPQVSLYADNTTVYFAHRDPSVVMNKLNEDLTAVAQWIENNGLKLNVSKTNLLVLSPRRVEASMSISINGESVRQQQHVKYLGVTVNKELNFKSHIANIRRCFAGLAILRRNMKFLPSNSRKMLYKAFIMSHLDYCQVLYNPCSRVLCEHLERIQNYAMRLITGNLPRTSSAPLHQNLGLTTLRARRQIATIIQVKCCLVGCAPLYMSGKFVINSNFG